MARLTDLTLEQAEALRLYRDYHLSLGHKWKQQLSNDWLGADWHLPDLLRQDDTISHLQSIRNGLGPSWLHRLTEKAFAIPPEVPYYLKQSEGRKDNAFDLFECHKVLRDDPVRLMFERPYLECLTELKRIQAVQKGLVGRYYIRSDGKGSASLFDREVQNFAGEPACLLPLGTYEECMNMRIRLLMPLVWTSADSEAALAEGWNLFCVDGNKRDLQLQRVDCPGDDGDEPLFRDDPHAWQHVLQDPTKLHQKALRVLQQQAPEEYQKIILSLEANDEAESQNEARLASNGYSSGDS